MLTKKLEIFSNWFLRFISEGNRRRGGQNEEEGKLEGQKGRRGEVQKRRRKNKGEMKKEERRARETEENEKGFGGK